MSDAYILAETVKCFMKARIVVYLHGTKLEYFSRETKDELIKRVKTSDYLDGQATDGAYVRLNLSQVPVIEVSDK